MVNLLFLSLEHFSGKDVHTLAAMINVENHETIGRSKQGIILAFANVQAGFDVRTTLTHENISRKYELASVAFDTKTLGIRVTTIAAGTATFFMCHLYLPLLTDLFNFKASILLAMAGLLANAFLGFVMEVDCLLTFEMLQNSGLHSRAFDSWRTYGDIVAIHQHEHQLNVNALAGGDLHAVDFNRTAFDGPILLAAAFNNCELHKFSPGLRFAISTAFFSGGRVTGKPGLT
jgi:hypothetical protein